MSLLEICKDRILNEMIEVCVKGGENSCSTGDSTNEKSKNLCYSILICDESTLKIVSSTCSFNECVRKGVLDIQLLSKKRQKFDVIDAIYFVKPDKISIKHIIEDFDDSNSPQYRNAHIFLTSSLGNQDYLLRDMANSTNLILKIKTLVEFNFHFIPYEKQIFHFDDPFALMRYYPLKDSEILQSVADKLISLFITLKVKPIIRYKENKFKVSKILASMIQQKLRSLPHSLMEGADNNCVILILDRSIDRATLLLHEFTYQAMVYDILEIPCCMSNHRKSSQSDEAITDDSFDYVATNNLGEEKSTKAILSEDDDIWVRFRHEHIQVVHNAIEEEVRLFSQQNAISKVNLGEAMKIEDTLKAVRSIPLYQERVSKYWTHVAMEEKCFSQLEKLNIIEIGSLEQDMACGVDNQAKRVIAQKLLSQLGYHLSDKNIREEEKIRLIILYMLHIDGISAADKAKMIEIGGIRKIGQRVIDRFMEMGLHLESKKKSVSKHEHVYSDKKSVIKFFKERVRSTNYELSRYEPAIKLIIKNLVEDNLDIKDFPFFNEFDSDDCGGIQTDFRNSHGISNVSKTEGEWYWKADDREKDDLIVSKRTDTDFGDKKARKKLNSSKRIEEYARKYIVFVVGGITFAETRSLYEISKALDVKNLYLGSDGIIIPSQLIEILKRDDFNQF